MIKLLETVNYKGVEYMVYAEGEDDKNDKYFGVSCERLRINRIPRNKLISIYGDRIIVKSQTDCIEDLIWIKAKDLYIELLEREDETFKNNFSKKSIDILCFMNTNKIDVVEKTIDIYKVRYEYKKGLYDKYTLYVDGVKITSSSDLYDIVYLNKLTKIR